MTVCLRCRRPLKNPTPTGLGPVCAKVGQSLGPGERDLFPYDIDRMVHEARLRLEAFIHASAERHQHAISVAFAEATIRLTGVVLQ